ncbi:uncharacterized protein LOC110095722 [Dendrobium catenatum]|uniref:uncharacterized protein LOC110095722 n=1 Tax=Dendrobium catenatum TaxID=906689 RepID=UPI0010A05FCB|nr:uncharacterized protein LOC110095722 [Dendrobium catenatum]
MKEQTGETNCGGGSEPRMCVQPLNSNGPLRKGRKQGKIRREECSQDLIEQPTLPRVLLFSDSEIRGWKLYTIRDRKAKAGLAKKEGALLESARNLDHSLAGASEDWSIGIAGSMVEVLRDEVATNNPHGPEGTAKTLENLCGGDSPPSVIHMFNILCWNCRGARKKETGFYLRHLIGTHNASFVGLLETKFEKIDRKDVDRLAGRDWDFDYQPSIGRAGGILVLWRSSRFSFQILFKAEQCLMGNITLADGSLWDVPVVYASKDRCTRRTMWEDLSTRHHQNLPLLVGEDFNCILSQEDKKGGRPFLSTPATCDMAEFMVTNDLVDPGFVGPAYTWTNNKDVRSRIFSRLDRFLVSSDILDRFQDLRVEHLTRLASDHCPILCTVQEVSKRTYSPWIRFEDVWLSFPHARHLSKEKFRRLNQLKQELDSEVRTLQELEGKPPGLNSVQTESLRFKVQLLNSTIARIMTWWRQRAKKWRGTDIVEQGWPSLTSYRDSIARFIGILDCDVSEDEILRATKSLGQNKAPGRDGIIASFFKLYWDIVGEQVGRACVEFFNSGVMDPSWKETVVVLITKVKNLDRPSKFRPISLCQTIYKIVVKVLVNRLKGVLPHIIYEEQATFVPGRSITTHCLLGQELMHKFKVSKATKGFFAMKVDMEQAYDKMSWQTLELVIERMGFPARFGAWVLSCVRNPKFSILVNGQLSNWITAECGFRQGCPLSPYLFILCSELLSAHFKQNFREMGVPISPGGPPVSHLLYADDILFFADVTMINARKTMSILTEYCSWTGQRVNRSKSAVLFSRWTPTATKKRMTRILGCCKVLELDYLGLKLATRRLTKVDISPLIQRAREHTLNWGIRHLSMAGRITLINSVLLPSSVFLMTHTIIPKSVLNDMERLCRSFLWDRDSEHKGMHYVAWDKVARPRRNGGLGFHVCARWTGALRAWVAWNIIGNPEGLLQRCLEHKYGDELRDLNPLGDTPVAGKAISSWPTFCDISDIENLTVSDFLREGGSWDLPKLRDCFGELLVDNITRIPVGEGTEKDCMELIKTPLGSTILSIVYNRMFDEEEDPICKILKLGLRPRVRLFWWRVYNDKVPTNVWLCDHHLQVDLLCPLGCLEAEDIDHIMTICNTLRIILDVLAGWGILMPRFSSFWDLQTELSRAGNAHDDWKKHGKGSFPPKTTAANVLEVLNQNFFSPPLEQPDVFQSARLLSSSSWCPPPPGWWKINLDGALRRSNVGGIGIVIRDDKGLLISAASWGIAHWDSTQVELLAFRYINELVLDWMNDVEGVIVEGDNASTFSSVRPGKDDLVYPISLRYARMELRDVYASSLPVSAYCGLDKIWILKVLDVLDVNDCYLSLPSTMYFEMMDAEVIGREFTPSGEVNALWDWRFLSRKPTISFYGC